MHFREKAIEFYEFNDFRIEVTMRRLVNKCVNEVIRLSPKNFELLLLLTHHAGQILTKEKIFDSLWQGQFVEENNLTVRISELRRALGEKRGENKYIETIPQSGYRFVAKVQAIEYASDTSDDNPEFHSLAVLPFVNESKDPNLGYLTDGLTESIINSLSQLRQIKIIARNTVFSYKGTEVSYHSMGQELNVQAVLYGRISDSENNLVISVELVNTRDKSQIWGDRYTYSITDLFKLEQEISKKVFSNLKLKFTAKETHFNNRYTKNWEAYILYLKGRYFWYKRSLKGINNAIKYFKRAIEKDSSYALAFSGLADCYTLLFSLGFHSPQKAFPKAKEMVLRSLELDDSLAEVHASLGYIEFYSKNWEEAEREFKRSIELNPNYAEARYWYASYLAARERFDEAFFELDKAQYIDPLSLAINKAICKTLYLAGRYEEAISKCLEALEVDADHVGVRGILGLSYLKKRMYEEAIQEFEKIIKLRPREIEFLGKSGHLSAELREEIFSAETHSESIGVLGYIYAVTGKRKLAFELLEGLLHLSKQRYVEPHSIAFIYLGLGEENQAFEWLEKLPAEDHSVTFLFWKVGAMFDALRSKARFKNLLTRIGLDW